MINLFVNTFTDPDSARNAELQDAFTRNAGLGLFAIHAIDGRPTFDEIFAFANEHTGPDDVNVFCNADIHFDESIKLAENIPPNSAYALTRWEWQQRYTPAGDPKPGKVLDLFGDEQGNHRIDSQDVWIWRGPCRVADAAFTPGTCGCDNHLTFLFMAARYEVGNPSKTIKAYHLHESDVRRYSKEVGAAVPMPYLLIRPHELHEQPQRDVRS